MVIPASSSTVSKIAVIGNYLPRKCGIATFTTDLCNALAAEMESDAGLIAVAMNDVPEGYDYPERVKFSIPANTLPEYLWLADYLNVNQYEVAILQHEYGIFGGVEGAHILHALKALQMPVLTNLHTVLKDPSSQKKMIVKEMSACSARLLVMSHKAVEFLIGAYGIPEDKIEFIPHGIPDVPFKQPGIHNDLLGLAGKDILLTFGLLGPGKGIENMIDAMPAIVAKNPSAVYVILGQTHPSVYQSDGDAYRLGLQQRVSRLGLQENVVFHNYFVDMDTLLQYLQTAKIYVIPYLNKEQITSGTLAYAMGAGAAVVSTPFYYAEEMLADGRGRLVPFRDSDAMAIQVNELLADENHLNHMRMLAYQHGRSMIWSEVARKHLRLADEVIDQVKVFPSCQAFERQSLKLIPELPEINLSHLQDLTDGTGIIQHAKYNIPLLESGYCVDDNSRALIASCLYYVLYKDRAVLPLLNKYLAFLLYAFNRDNGYFRNFMSYDRRWLDLSGTEDAHGRSIWALGVAVNYAPDGARSTACDLLTEAMGVLPNFRSPRAWAYAIIGLGFYLRSFEENSSAFEIRDRLARRLLKLFKANRNGQWLWCEDILTYDNAKLPHALILAGKDTGNSEMMGMGLEALEWLLRIQSHPGGHLSIIGNGGWYPRDGYKANFAQQPTDVMNLIDACVDACIITGERKWLEKAECCFGWFMGLNDLRVPVYNFETGGCFDGLESYGVNRNQGAESTIIWLISLLRMHQSIGIVSLL